MFALVEENKDRGIKILQRPDGSLIRVEAKTKTQQEDMMDANYLLIYAENFNELPSNLLPQIRAVCQDPEFQDVDFKFDVNLMRVGVLFTKKENTSSAWSYIDLMERLETCFSTALGEENVLRNLYLGIN